MALYYLSGDIGMAKKTKKPKAQKKAEKKQKKTAKKTAKKNMSKSEKKNMRKKKVAKIALAPSRAAFLAAVNLNALKLATKLARIYKAPGGQAKLQNWWVGKFKGDFNKLKQGIAKGAHETIACDDMGVALETLVATALPIIIAVAPLIKEFRAGGDAAEASAFDQGVNDGKQTLNDGEEFEKFTAEMPEDVDVAKAKSEDEGGGGGGEANFFSPVGLIFKLCFIAAMMKANGFDIAALTILSLALVTASAISIGFYNFSLYGKDKIKF